MGELYNKIVLVTGADSGIGRGIAEVCAREGASVIVSSLDLKKSQKVVDGLSNGENNHSSFYLDVTSKKDQQNGINFILEKYGRIDGLVNNAGIDFGKPILQTSFEEWNKVINTNLESVFSLSQLTIPYFMEQKGGSIVNITSVHALSTYEGSGPYAASKAAINSLSKSLACEFGKHNIKVNCVAPGLVKTGIWDKLIEDFDGNETECIAYWNKNIPNQKIIEPREIGEIVSFLLSDRASSLNGAVIYADGGLTSQLIAKND